MIDDKNVKHIFNRITVTVKTNYGQIVRGKVIGWKRSKSGALGAIIVFPNSDRPGKYLYIVNPSDWFDLRYEETLH